MYIEVFLRHTQAYSANSRLCVTLTYSQLLEPEKNSKPCKTLTRYIQNPATVRTVYPNIIHPYSGIFRTLHKACICKNLANLESWNIQNTSIIAS